MTQIAPKDYYEILQVGNKASVDEIKREFKKLALKYHPDKNPGDSEAAVRFRDLAEAYAILSDDKKRKDYDAEREQTMEANLSEPLAHSSFTFTAEELRQSFRSPSYWPDISQSTSTTTPTTNPCDYSIDPILFGMGNAYGPMRTKKKRSDPWKQKTTTESKPVNVPKKRGRPPQKPSLQKQSNSFPAKLPKSKKPVQRDSYETLMATHQFMFQFLPPSAVPTPAISVSSTDPNSNSFNRTKGKVQTKTFATTPVFATA